MERDRIRRSVERWLLEGLVAGNLAVFDELLSSDVLDHSAAGARGPESFKQRARAVRAAFSDLSASLEQLLIDDDQVAWRWSLEATHTATFAGISATRRRVTLRGVNFQRWADARVVEHWTLVDTFGLMQALGS